MSDWRQVSTVLAGDSAEYAVDDFKKLFNLLAGGNQTLVDISSTGKWQFSDNVLQLANPAKTFEYHIRTSAIASDFDVTLPLITAAGSFVITQNTNDFGAGTTQIFRDGTIRLQPPAGGPYYTVSYGTAPAANRTITIPVLTANGNMVIDSFLNVFTAAQRIALNTQDLFILNRDTGNVTGSGSRGAIRFDLQNDTLVDYVAGYLLFENVNTTTGSENSKFSVWTKTAGTALEQFGISSSGVVTSPLWAVNLVMNNALAIQMKESGGTARSILQLTSGNQLQLGTGVSSAVTTAIFSGAASSAVFWDANNFATFQRMPQTGVAETLAKWVVTDDATSAITFENSFSTDGFFGPTVRLYYGGASNSTGINVLHQILSTQDTGTNPIANYNFRLNTGTLAVRPLLALQSASTEVWRMLVNGDILQTIKSQTGIGEVVHTWTVGDDTGSSLQLLNFVATDGQFSPFIIGNISTNVPTNIPAIGFRAQIPVASDTGATTMFLFESRAVGADVLNRTLFEFRNRNTQVMSIAAKGNVTETIIAQTGVAELLHTWTVGDADANSYLRAYNASATDAAFTPKILGSTSTAGVSGLLLWGWIAAANDSGSTGIINIDARRYDATAIATRPLITITNLNTQVWKINPLGDITHTITSQAGIAELVEHWGMSDNATAYFRISNLTATDGVFAPRIVTYNFGAGTGMESLRLQSYIEAGSDSGSVAIQTYDVRRSTEAAITTRPLFEWRNFGTSILQLGIGFLDFKTNEIRNVIGSNTMSEIEGWQTNKRTGHLHGGNAVGAEFGTGLFAPKGLGFYGSVTWATGMYGNGGVFTGDQTIVNADGVFGYKTAMNLRRDRQIKLSIKARIDRQSASRFFVILKSNSTQLTAGTQTPLATNEGGIAIGWNELNANYRVWTCDALGTVTNTDTGLAIPAFNNDAEYLELSVDSAGTTWTWAIWNLGHTTILATGTVTATVPTISHLFSFHIHGEITDATSSQFMIWSGDIEAIK